MYQQEIKFFWPLTEQIPLDLDYSVCERPKKCVQLSSTNYIINNGNVGIGDVMITCSNFKLDVDTTVIKVKEKPTLLRRMLYNGLGLKWEIK